MTDFIQYNVLRNMTSGIASILDGLTENQRLIYSRITETAESNALDGHGNVLRNDLENTSTLADYLFSQESWLLRQHPFP